MIAAIAGDTSATALEASVSLLAAHCSSPDCTATAPGSPEPRRVPQPAPAPAAASGSGNPGMPQVPQRALPALGGLTPHALSLSPRRSHSPASPDALPGGYSGQARARRPGTLRRSRRLFSQVRSRPRAQRPHPIQRLQQANTTPATTQGLARSSAAEARLWHLSSQAGQSSGCRPLRRAICKAAREFGLDMTFPAAATENSVLTRLFWPEHAPAAA